MNRIKLGMVLALIFSGVGSAYAVTIRPAIQSMCHDSNYTCFVAERGDSWKSLFPDANMRDLVKRLNRVNTSVHPGLAIVVPNDLENATLMSVSPFSAQISPPGRKLLVFDHSKYAWAAYQPDGQLVTWGPASGGKDFCLDTNKDCNTPVGRFAIYEKRGAGCFSTQFPVGKGGAPMPYCMFFRGGFAFHGSSMVPGYHASHGCVRIYTEDARWLNQEFVESPNASNGYKGTEVVVYSR